MIEIWRRAVLNVYVFKYNKVNVVYLLLLNLRKIRKNRILVTNWNSCKRIVVKHEQAGPQGRECQTCRLVYNIPISFIHNQEYIVKLMTDSCVPVIAPKGEGYTWPGNKDNNIRSISMSAYRFQTKYSLRFILSRFYVGILIYTFFMCRSVGLVL